MKMEELFNPRNIIDMSFFNFNNAITAAYFADKDLNIQKVNANFKAFFPMLGNVLEAYFPSVLHQLGVDEEQIESFSRELAENGHVLIPKIVIKIDGKERVFSLLSAKTRDENFSYLNGVQGQFIDRTDEFELRREREELLEEKIRNREIIEEKTRNLEVLANRLAKYLSPQIYEAIFTGKSDVKQGFARKNLTIFFSDIAGFTDITDGMEPERLAFVINTYLSEMSAIALDCGGTIDKFIGDAMLVFFGDPETDGEKEDAIKCAQMALRMQQRIEELQDTWKDHGVSKPIRVRMGVSTGFCTVGNFGSDQRLEYTAIGNPVNLAARLEDLADPGTILISESTHVLIEGIAECQEMGEVTPKGFARPIGTFQLDRLKDEGKKIIGKMALTRVGKYVEVNLPDGGDIREAIIELKEIRDELKEKLRIIRTERDAPGRGEE